jgi:hypothetical protein
MQFAVAQEDCRVKEKDLKPIIARFNPFFTEHRWMPVLQQELARIDKERYLVISHHGCKRHYIVFNLFLQRSCIQNSDSFWVQEARNLMRAVYYNTPEYALFGKDFEDNFTERLAEIGLNKEFNFPLGMKNFLCEITYATENESAKIRVEMVEYVFAEELVEKKRVPNLKDDGLYEKKEIIPIIPTAIPENSKHAKKKRNN